MPNEGLFTWARGRLVPDLPDDVPPLVADSWLVADGRVRGLDLHRRRFFRGCGEKGDVDHGELRAFWQAALGELPRRGRLFPRVELVTRPGTALRLRIRPAPPPGSALRVGVWDGPDPRTAPRLKGPDLGRLAEIRRRAAARADEVLLVTRSGIVLEATTTSLVWWEGADLCLPSPALRILPGVTARLIEELARRAGTRIHHRRGSVADLDRREAWLVNALHGIRPVSAWVGAPVTAGPATRAAGWQSRLAALAERLD